MRHLLLRSCAALALLNAVAAPQLAHAQSPAPTAPSLNTAPDTATLRERLNAALARDDLPAAWLAMRAWKDAAPTDPAARLVEARLYSLLDAPAAVITSANAGLVLLDDSTRPLERPLLALKAHAHAAVGEHAPAWAAYTRLLATAPAGADTNADPDPLLATARRARWDAFAQLTSGDAHGRFLSRLVSAASAPDAPPAAHLRLSRWLSFNGQPEAARTTLQNALVAHPTSRELVLAVADQLIGDARDARDSGQGFADQTAQADLARFAADPALDPFTYAVLDFWALLPDDAAPAPTPAKLPATREKLEGLLTDTTLKMENAAEQYSEWLNAPAPPSSAELIAWEKTATTAFITQRAVEAKLQTLPAPEEESPYRELARNASDALPETVVGVRWLRVQAEAREALAAAQTPAQILAATEQVIATGDLSPPVWRARFAAAQSLGDIPETLASGARAFATEWAQSEAGLEGPLPPQTLALQATLEKLVGDAPALVRQAVTAWETGDAATALTKLDQALALDPASPTAWRLRWQWSESSGDDAAALLALDRWWRLDDATSFDTSAALGLASRMGAWELLLSLADARLAQTPTDTEAHLFRAHAAIACDRLDVARESLAVVDVSLHRNTGKMLEVITYLLDPDRKQRANPINSIINIVGTPQAPSGLAEWNAYYYRLERGAKPSATKPADLAAQPAAIHTERLHDRINAADYLARTRGTPEAATARFINFLIARHAGPTDETKALAELIADDRSLPLSSRAVAHRFRVLDEGRVLAPALRAGDPFYASPALIAASNWGAPGQEIVIASEVQATNFPAAAPIRLRGLVGSRARLTSTGVIPVEPGSPSRLWELRNLTALLKFDPAASADAKPPILDCAGVSFDWDTKLTLAGAARLVACSASMLSLDLRPGTRLESQAFSAVLRDTNVAGTWHASGGSLNFPTPAKIASTGQVTVSDANLAGVLPFTLAPGATATWRNVVGSSRAPWPSALPAGWTIDGARLTAPPTDAASASTPPITKLPAPHRGEIYTLADRDAAPTVQVKTIDELHAALATARPGAVIELAAGKHLLLKPLVVPPGVALRAAPDAKVALSRGSPAAFQFFKPGANRVRGFFVAVEHIPHMVAGIETTIEDFVEKSAVVVGPGAWVFVEGGHFNQWHHRAHTVARVASGGRLELHDHHITEKTVVAPDGVLVRAPTSASPMDTLRGIVATQARAEQRALAAQRFTRDIARATDLAQREQAIRTLSDLIGETGHATGASDEETTRTTFELLNPVLLRFPDESPKLFSAVRNYHARHEDTVRAMLPESLRPYFRASVESYYAEQRLGGDKVSMDNIYRFLLAYPPGHPDYTAAKSAMERGLTTAQFEVELAASKQRAIELAAALEKQRAASAARWAEEQKRAALYAPSTSNTSASTYSGSSWSASSYAPRTYTAPAWTPSESYKMQVYKHNLDVQISGATRRY